MQIDKPQTHLIQAKTLEEVEDRINSWVKNSGLNTMVLPNFNILPLIIKGEILFVGVIIYTGADPYKIDNDMSAAKKEEGTGTGGQGEKL